jgi:hypothetical protein
MKELSNLFATELDRARYNVRSNKLAAFFEEPR